MSVVPDIRAILQKAIPSVARDIVSANGSFFLDCYERRPAVLFGREFFIRRDAAPILEHLYRYNDRILKEILVISNGSIVPSAETVTALKDLAAK
ncbi:hypothetical protein ACPUYX_01620 [Desulfosporosinus sp. SYSU MS00001]|uniref:hypothetical protein n=1 Tax=Desulfosporosinus sp. SYSU MS00001 TaxID=3416284 RepID=UPI003CE6CEAA